MILESYPQWNTIIARRYAKVLTTRKLDPDRDDLPDIGTMLYFLLVE
jgi:hypothetical protein